MKVICIDASNKPAKISLDEWVEEGVVYTISSITRMGLQPNKLGLKLVEVKLTEKSFPYEFYDADRFIIIDELLKAKKEEAIVEEELELNIV